MAGSERISSGRRRTIGVLALQGDVGEHERILGLLGARTTRVRRPEDLVCIDGLVLPGGESTTIDRLARAFGVRDTLVARIRDGLPVFATCAGMILLADRILGGIRDQQTFGGLDVTVRRNAFGRQNQSFETELSVRVLGEPPVRAVFIRAPVIEDPGRATPLAALDDGRVVAVEQGALLATAFHPEQTGETRFHERFLAAT